MVRKGHVLNYMAVAYCVEYSAYLSQLSPSIFADVPHGCDAGMLGRGGERIDIVVSGV